MRRTAHGLVLLLATCLLCACGQTGPLYLPGEQPPERDQVPDTQPELFP